MNIVVWYPAAVGSTTLPMADGPPGTPFFVEGLLDPPVGHFTFVTQCAPAGTAGLRYLCADSGPVRAKAHEATITLARDFFTVKLGR